jgi:hypothetical protein
MLSIEPDSRGSEGKKAVAVVNGEAKIDIRSQYLLNSNPAVICPCRQSMETAGMIALTAGFLLKIKVLLGIVWINNRRHSRESGNPEK